MKLELILLLFIISVGLKAQDKKFSTNNQKAIGYYEAAQKYYNTEVYKSCLDNIENALEADSLFLEAYFLKAEVYFELKDFKNEVATYNKIVSIKEMDNPKFFLLKGEAELKIGAYKKAQESLFTSLKLSGLSASMKNKAKLLFENTNFALEALQNPIDYKIKRLSDSINTENNDYWPSLTADEKTLITNR
ncbi:MAG: hypothetical protein IPO21_12870 [Bacteroidales bacterium]|nr:hypothetical protein [Bacteroidales bacterium]